MSRRERAFLQVDEEGNGEAACRKFISVGSLESNGFVTVESVTIHMEVGFHRRDHLEHCHPFQSFPFSLDCCFYFPFFSPSWDPSSMGGKELLFVRNIFHATMPFFSYAMAIATSHPFSWETSS